jgi:WD40 repeat protein
LNKLEHTVSKWKCLLAFFSSALLLANPLLVVAQQGQLTLVSVNSAGTGTGNRKSGEINQVQITPNGRFVLFYSASTDIVPLGATNTSDIFVRDLQTGQTKMASINAAGTPSTDSSRSGLISDDGRFAAFNGFADDIVNNDSNSSGDVFVRDFQTNTTKLVSFNFQGTASGALGESLLTDMTPDARFIVFSSVATNITSQTDGNGVFETDLYVRDLANNVTKLITVNTAGTASGNGPSFGGKISADGRYVAFLSDATNLVNGSDTSERDVFLRDLQTNTTTRISTNAAGTAGGNGPSGGIKMDKGGRFVVYSTRATDVANVPDVNGFSDIFIYDIQAQTKKLITVNTAGTATGGGQPSGNGEMMLGGGTDASISADGRFIAFQSAQTDLVNNDTNGTGDDIFRYEIATGAKTLVSVNLTGTSGVVGRSFMPNISADGRFIGLASFATDLVNIADEPNFETMDVFLRDMMAGQTYLVSANHSRTRTGNGSSIQPLLTSDGRRLAFVSTASDLITNDLNGTTEDVFVFTLINDGAPVLLTEENTERAIALESVTLQRDPFALVAPIKFGVDQRTRISLFVWGLLLLPGEPLSAITVRGEDTNGAHTLTVESVGDQAGVTGAKQVVVKLPDQVVGTDLSITVSLHGLTSNRALVKIKP